MCAEWFEKFDPITADFTYLRLLGDRKEIEERTKVWREVIVDRRAEMSEWAGLFRPIVKRGVILYVYANNHYAGFGPTTAQAFKGLLGVEPSAIPGKRAIPEKERTLFD